MFRQKSMVPHPLGNRSTHPAGVLENNLPGHATFRAVPGSGSMNTFLKILLFVLAALLVLHFWPLAVAPFLVIAGAVLLLGTVAASGVAVIVSVVVGVLGSVLGLVCALAAVLSPIWIPVVLVLGIVALVRRSSRAVA